MGALFYFMTIKLIQAKKNVNSLAYTLHKWGHQSKKHYKWQQYWERYSIVLDLNGTTFDPKTRNKNNKNEII